MCCLLQASSACTALQVETVKDITCQGIPLRLGCFLTGLHLPCLRLLCRFGTEHEKLGYFVDSHRRIDHEAISKLLHQICTRFSWQPIMEKGNIIGATLENASVTLEPGGQFELSGAPLDSLHKTCSEVNSHLYEAGAPRPPVTTRASVALGQCFWTTTCTYCTGPAQMSATFKNTCLPQLSGI